jgi:two-component system alkaline phosphatase synthesis response regulator PhoP
MMSTRLVVCDDEAHITRAISMKLSKAGYDVETAPDGQAAWEAIQRECPAMVITDCQMPRMGGLELCRRLREQPETANLPVILLTAKGFELNEAELKSELRLSHLMCKPFSPRELLKTVQETLAITEDATMENSM